MERLEAVVAARRRAVEAAAEIIVS